MKGPIKSRGTTISIITVLAALSKNCDGLATSAFFDRYKANCPADPNCINQFEPSLVKGSTKESSSSPPVWVAVYRSRNNLPSVFLRDDFLNSMKVATTATSSSSSSSIETTPMDKNDDVGVRLNSPVAVARLSPSTGIIDMIRCSLKKEETNSECEGGSEHAEALSICIDELVLHHLRQETGGVLKCKGTLVAGPLLEERGFEEIEEFSVDMVTHVLSNVELSMGRFAKRVVGGEDVVEDVGAAKSPGARDRATQILSLLGKLEPDNDDVKDEISEDDDDKFDPWASVKQFI